FPNRWAGIIKRWCAWKPTLLPLHRILDTPLPLAASAGPELESRVKSRRHIEQSDHWKQERPNRVQPVVAHRREKTKCHKHPRCSPDQPRSWSPAEHQKRRSHKCDRETKKHRHQQQAGMSQLTEGSSRDHVTDCCKRPVRTDTLRFRCKSKPDASATLLHFSCERAVINDFAANRCDPSCSLKRLRSDQHASTRSACRPPIWIGNPWRRVKHEEEEHKCGNQGPLRKRAAMQ